MVTKYILKDTDLILNKVLIKEGTEVSLDDKEADNLKSFLVKVNEQKPVTESAKSDNNKKVKNK